MAELATSGFPASATASCWFQRTNINAVVTVLRTRTCCQPSAKARLCACLECLKALVLAIASRLGRLLGAATARLRRVAHGGRHMQNRRPGEQPQRHQYQLAPVARGPGHTSRPGRQSTRTPAAAGRSRVAARGTARGSPPQPSMGGTRDFSDPRSVPLLQLPKAFDDGRNPSPYSKRKQQNVMFPWDKKKADHAGHAGAGHVEAHR